jgi:hypothetical protein
MSGWTVAVNHVILHMVVVSVVYVFVGARFTCTCSMCKCGHCDVFVCETRGTKSSKVVPKLVPCCSPTTLYLTGRSLGSRFKHQDDNLVSLSLNVHYWNRA